MDHKPGLQEPFDLEDFLSTQMHILSFEDLKLHAKVRFFFFFEVLFPRQLLLNSRLTENTSISQRHYPPPPLPLSCDTAVRSEDPGGSFRHWRMKQDAGMVQKQC